MVNLFIKKLQSNGTRPVKKSEAYSLINLNLIGFLFKHLKNTLDNSLEY